jgi:hypothetical protein
MALTITVYFLYYDAYYFLYSVYSLGFHHHSIHSGVFRGYCAERGGEDRRQGFAPST